MMPRFVLQEPAVDLSVAFSGASVQESACFLRFIYKPDDAALTCLALLNAGVLAAVAGLAHKLNAGRLLARIDAFLQGKLEKLQRCSARCQAQLQLADWGHAAQCQCRS